MSFDVLVGISSSKLNDSIAKVYSDPGLQERLFSGSKSGDFQGLQYSGNWRIAQAPQIQFTEPTGDQWTKAISATGGALAQVPTAFVVQIPQLALKIDAAGENIDTSAPVTAICSVQNSGGKATLKALGVVNTFTDASPFDRFMITSVLIPSVLKMINKTLGGLNIPAPNLPGVSLTQPFGGIQNNCLLLAFNMANAGAPSFGNLTIPNEPFFVLADPAVVQLATNYVLATQARGKKFSKSGSDGAAGFSGSYYAQGIINNVSAKVSSDPTRFKADVSISMSASAGFSTPINKVVKTIEKGVKKLDPTKW